MRWDAGRAREAFTAARVARLATVGGNGQPHVVPIVFAVSVDDVLYSAVDAKPKSTTKLRRLANIAANSRVSLLVDHYDDDWSQLWWARADGRARVAGADEDRVARALLTGRYPVYREQPPPGPVLAVDIERWSGWSARDQPGATSS